MAVACFRLGLKARVCFRCLRGAAIALCAGNILDGNGSRFAPSRCGDGWGSRVSWGSEFSLLLASSALDKVSIAATTVPVDKTPGVTVSPPVLFTAVPVQIGNDR